MTTTSSNKANFKNDIKRFSPLLKNLVSKDFKLKYRRSVLGVAWSVLNPLFTMLVITTVFGTLLKVQVEHFATYYILGFSIWNFFSEATSLSISSILTAAPLIKKVYVPKYIFPIEKCLFALVNFVFSLMAVAVVMLYQGVVPSIYSLLAFIPVLYCFIFVCGASLFLSAATVYFRDIQHLYGVFLTVLMYLTPIIYPLSLVDGHPLVSTVVRLNPMTHYVEYFRKLVMYGQMPGLKENIVCCFFALIVFAIGALVFKKAEGKFILHI